ncbi:MAG TPA: hypothetical protein DEO70_13840 [Bacteroidales bacterium]|nr:MAG: hypothetical protein A2X11_13835 [Bacteroidetes bacterium GWE2_42_24]HBZ67910.1 hypothetical protein [Bacteroidales bacterium]
MTRKTILGTALVLLLALTRTSGQTSQPNDTATFPYWIGMMQDESVNFYDVQRAFNVYWKDRAITKGCGYKPFKRWEYRMQNGRIYPDGTRRPANRNLKAAEKLAKAPLTLTGEWVSLGPAAIPVGKGYKGLGRLNAIGFHPTDPNTFYVGAPSGGLWKTTDGAATWVSTTDVLPTLGVSSIVVDHSNPQTIYIGTGDRDAGDAPGYGVLRSTDGGATWELWNTGMGEKTVGRMIQHPTNSQIIYAATSAGVYKTTNGGATWGQKKGGNINDIVFKPNNPDILYAISSGNFFRSTDAGENWTSITNGYTTSSRAVVAVTPANPEYVYVLQSQSDNGFKALLRSTNGGTSFDTRSTSPNILDWSCDGSGSGGQSWYDLEIAADPANAELIFTGGVNIWKSYNGGQTWEITGHWYGGCNVTAVHADHHVYEYSPVNNKLYIGTDGGIYSSADQGANWTIHTNGLVITQIYKIGQDATNSSHVILGAQDNGSSTMINNSWYDSRGGDGMECAVDPLMTNLTYATLYYGNIARLNNNSSEFTVAANGSFGIDEEGDWVTPFILHETDPSIMFVGYKNIWRGTNLRGFPVWTKISNSLNGSNSSNMKVLEQSPANIEILYAGRSDQRLFRTDNANQATPIWTDLTNLLPASGNVSDIEAHPYDENIVYLSQDGKIFKSTDKGQTWTNISGSLPDVNFSSIAYYKGGVEALYVSSDIGVFYRDAFMNDWVNFSQGLPVDASINEVEVAYNPANPQNDRLSAGTYGRGLWASPMYRSVPAADFIADQTTVPTASTVNFTDQSAGVPSDWVWTFEGGTPSTSSHRNPSIVYNTQGVFRVKLKVMNQEGIDSITKESYITVSGSLLPSVGFTADNKTPCSGLTVKLTDTTLYNPTSWLWTITPNTFQFVDGTSATSQNPSVLFTENKSYTVTLQATNVNGSSSVTRENYIQMGGFDGDYLEDFESGSLSDNGWTIINPDGQRKWEITAVFGPVYNENNHAARMEMFGYTSMSTRDQLISPALNLKNFTNPHLLFKYAYAQRAALRDSLIVKVSADCGQTWTRVWAGGPDGEGAFVTSMPTASSFVPASLEDWCGSGYGADCQSISLSPWLTYPNIKLMFESFNKAGNNLYIDEVQITNSSGTVDQMLNSALSITPNPGHGTFKLTTPTNQKYQIVLTDATGRVVWNTIVSGANTNPAQLNLTGIASGVYVLSISGDDHSENTKLIIR